MKRLFLTFIASLSFIAAFADTATNSDASSVSEKTSKFLESSDKIYVVVATIVIVFICLAIYLFMMDGRLRKLEREEKQHRG